ncbi:MAG: phosphocholine cytidylyltransferase family protein [Bacteroidales bacterium]|jgi:choline kinase
MRYILLAAGKGTRLNPLAKNCPKCMYNLDKNMTVIEFMIGSIKKFDMNAEFVIVTGFMQEKLEKLIKNVIFIYNPFYKITNSIASLWFAKDYIEGDITIINADIIAEKRLIKNIVIKKIEGAKVLIDSSIKQDGDYNVQVKDNNVVVMSKDLKKYFGEYAGITKLDRNSSKKLCIEIEKMINNENYDQWYENALVQMIFEQDFKLEFIDISDFEWTEIDTVDDLLNAKEIYLKES